MSMLGRPGELVARTNDGSLRWQQDTDGTLMAFVSGGFATLRRRADDGSVRLVLSAEPNPILFETSAASR